MPETTTTPLVENITAQLHELSVDELRTIQDFVAYMMWKRQQNGHSTATRKSAEERAVERIPDLDDPSQWITVVHEDDEIDEAALDDWLKARGYQE